MNERATFKFHVSLTKHRSDLLEKAQIHIWNIQGIKFCFTDPIGYLRVKFTIKATISWNAVHLPEVKTQSFDFETQSFKPENEKVIKTV